MKALKLTLAFLILVPFAVMADGTLVSFNGGIGVTTQLIAVTVATGAGSDPDPTTSGGDPDVTAVTPVPNMVCNAGPGGVPWRIEALQAVVDTSGHIIVQGRGLLLAGGSPTNLNLIGRNGGQSVKVELFCNTTASDCGPAHTSGLVPLEPNGDFMINDTLSPPVPSSCSKPVLLITNGTVPPRWFAAGIPAS